MAIYDPTQKLEPSYDAHTHLNDDKLFRDVPAYLGRAHEFEVREMNVVGYDRVGNQRALEIAQNNDGVYAVLGYQPEDTAEFDEAARAELAEQVKEDKVVGIGETGLDYHWDIPKEQQTQAFLKHIELAKETGLPLVIHNREAFDDVYAILKDSGLKKVIIHSFSGTPEQARAWVELGYYVSFSGVVTFKKAQEVRDAAHVVPVDKILVETDAPYLAPVPVRGKTNEPAFVKFVIDDLAKTLDMPVQHLAEITRTNARRVFLNHD
ncbi:TatD family hydrolase [Eupransor demetentiae]|uniref:3'->5' ssDNA/RNA exonuclease TatD (TatD) n=1 Tax=Eupransor demetentiae TaxID=3109584 RepID=A0ABM9N3B3_9LACO|nr:3'->5' ssDNA/RNA exonuclease TatD (TatD) [Lactobacillaceae bacterium LMG 33000]